MRAVTLGSAAAAAAIVAARGQQQVAPAEQAAHGAVAHGAAAAGDGAGRLCRGLLQRRPRGDFGEALKARQVPRCDIVVSTKLFASGDGPNEVGLSRKHILEGTKASLARLQLDYLDMVLAHRPDDSTPVSSQFMPHNLFSGSF